MKKHGGFTLLEVIIALGILTIGLLSVLVLFNLIFASAGLSSSHLIASNLAQEGIELVRNIRDTNWLEDEDWDNGLIYCLNCGLDYDDFVLNEGPDYLNTPLEVNANGFYNYDPGTETLFSRSIDVDKQGNVIEITCTVQWSERGRTHSVIVDDQLYEWQE